MSTMQDRQRISIRRAREETPIINVFLKENPQTIYSVAVPQSKSWAEFIDKIKRQFDIDPSFQLKIYQFVNNNNNNNNNNNTDNKNIEYVECNIVENDMSNIKHKASLAISIPNNNNDSNLVSLTDIDNNFVSISKNNDDDINDNDNHDNSDNIGSNDDHDHGNRVVNENNDIQNNVDVDIMKNETENSMNLGLNIDLFGHNIQNINNSSHLNLSFDMKEVYLLLHTHSLKCFHENDKFTIMKDEKNGIILRTRRLIWPSSFQSYPINDVFEFNFDTIKEHWYWAIILCHGGRFAAAIYNGDKIILHKTINRYVVRKKQGKRQANFLSMGKHSQSAGSYKREWNEKKLYKEIQYVLSLWQEYLQHKCHKIFVHAPGIINEQTLFGTHDEQAYLYPINSANNNLVNQQLSNDRLSDIANTFNNVIKSKKDANDHSKIHDSSLFRLFKKDNRIVKIPLTTHAPTMQECKRIHSYLSNAWITFQNYNTITNNLNKKNICFDDNSNNNNEDTLNIQSHNSFERSNLNSNNENEIHNGNDENCHNNDNNIVIVEDDEYAS